MRLVTQERDRQILTEGFNPDLDDKLKDGDLALLGICYATPTQLYRKHLMKKGVVFSDPFPWEGTNDKRMFFSKVKGELPKPEDYNDKARIDLLIKGAACIIAEVEKQLRRQNGNNQQ